MEEVRKVGLLLILVETLVDKRSWERIKQLVLVGYNWRAQYISRRNRKGRAMEGIVVGVKLGTEKGGDKLVWKEGKNKEERLVEVKVRQREE